MMALFCERDELSDLHAAADGVEDHAHSNSRANGCVALMHPL